jgi:general secretion pathway protein K
MADNAAANEKERTPPRAGGQRRRRARKGDKRGVALIMVLGAITVLTVFLTELQEETSSELSSALADRDALRAEYYARSAVNLSRLLIATEPTIRKALGPILMAFGQTREAPQIPIWKFSDMILGPFNDQLGVASFAGITGADPAAGKNLGLTGGGRFELKIVDEESKINLNRAADDVAIGAQLQVGAQLMGLIGPQQYNPMFEGRDADDQFTDRTSVCSALVDWVDSGDRQFSCDFSSNAGSSGGVEDSFYETLGLGYRRKNAAFDSIDEVRFVRGMGDDFWATFVDPDPNDPDKRLMTVWGRPTSAVNVTTATPQTLLAVVCGAARPDTKICAMPEQTAAFLSVLSLAQGIIPGGIVFPTKGDFFAAITQANKPMIGAAVGQMLKSLGVEPVTFNSPAEFKKTLSQDTKFLSIYADGVVPGNKRETRVRIHAVVDLTGAKSISASSDPNSAGTGGAGGSSGATVPPESAWEQTVRSNPAGTIIYYRIE